MSPSAFRVIRLAFLSVATCLLLAQTAAAEKILRSGHVDIEVGYEDGQWHLGLHDEETDTEFEADEAVLFVKNKSIVKRPAGGGFDFIGVGANQPLWLIPEVLNPELLQLGFTAEGTSTADFDPWEPNDPRRPETARWIEWMLVDFDGPGDFSVFQNTGGDPLVWMSTFSNPNPNVFYSLVAFGHQDLNFAFTMPGEYKVTLRTRGLLSETGAFSESHPVTYTFRVQAVPEPSALISASVGAGALCVLAALRRRSQARRSH